MAYTISSALAIYFVLWWIVLFVTLPFGTRSQSDSEETVAGTEPGAPVAPFMARKLLWTTIISGAIYAAAMLLYEAGFLNIAWLSKVIGLPI